MLGILFSMLLFPFFFFFRCFWHYFIGGLFFLSFFFLFDYGSFGTFYSSFSGMFVLDNFSFWLIVLSLYLTSLMILASYKVNLGKYSSFSFVFVVMFLLFVLIMTFSFSNIFFFYFFFEFSLVPTLVLILGWGYQPERLTAGMYMMMYTIGASLPLLISIFFYFFMNNNFSFYYSSFVSSSWGVVEFFFSLSLFLAFLVKFPIYFFHLWLPKAHVEAPVAGSMILAGVLLKLGGFGVYRFISVFYSLFRDNIDLVCGLSLWGGVLTGLICLRQSDMKSLVAYSSVGHMSIVILGLFSIYYVGLFGGLLVMIAHGLCSPALFSLCNSVYEMIGSRGVVLNKGMLNVFSSFSIWWFIFCAANMAAPPSLNLIGEIFLIGCGIMFSSFYALFLGMMGFLAAGYSLYLYVFSQHGHLLSSYNSFLTFGSRSFFLYFMHFWPLILLVAGLDFFFWGF